jgi:hypothetical protein
MAYLPPDERVSLQGEAKLLEEQRGIYKELAEGGPSAAAAQNKLAYAQALAKMPNVSANEAADMLLKIANIHRTIMGETGELPWGTDVSSQLGNKDQILKYMQQMQGSVDIYTHPVINVDSLASPSGKEAVKIASSLISPNYHPDALRINSQSIDKFLDHVAAIKDPDAATQAADVYVKQMLDSAKAANMPVGKMLDAASLAKLNTHLGSLMGSFRSGRGQVDYDPQLNTFSYLNEDGSVNKIASDRANMIFKAVISANGFTDEDTIDKWGSTVSANAMKSAPRGNASERALGTKLSDLYPESPRLANILELEKEIEKATSPATKAILISEYENIRRALEETTIPGMAQARMNMETLGPPPQNLEELKRAQQVLPDPSIPVVTSKALLEPTPVVQPGISLELARDLREKKPKAIVTPQQESTKRAIENLEAQDKGFKASPMMKRNPATDAVAPTTVTEAMIESLGQVHPAAGMAAAAALVAFGGVKGAPELAKLMPKLLNPAGKVTTGSNVVLAGGNVGANKAIVTSILATAEKTKKARMESLYKEYWKTGWQKDRMELPKTDVEWSQAIVQANEYVARKMNPEMFKTMKGK